MQAHRLATNILRGVVLLSPINAFAQVTLTSVNTLLQNVLNVMQGIGVVAVSIAILYVGYKMVFQQARWSDIANIVFGAAFIGGATSIAHWLLG
jgi:type IV secretory pathway VirB2 component (pilin)